MQKVNIITNCTLQTASNDPSFPFTLSNISPPVFVQPLPEILSALPAQQVVVDHIPHILLSNPQIVESTTYNTHTCGYVKSSSDLLDYSMDDLSPTAEDLSNYSPASPSFSTNPDFYDLLVNQPPPSILPSSEASSIIASEVSSALASEVNSAPASDSDLPPLTANKATKQTNLLGFFSKMPSDEHHAKWQKRKRDDEDRDREEYTKRKQRDEVEKAHNLTIRREKNKASQKKRRNRLKKEQTEAGQDSSVSLPIYTL